MLISAVPLMLENRPMCVTVQKWLLKYNSFPQMSHTKNMIVIDNLFIICCFGSCIDYV